MAMTMKQMMEQLRQSLHMGRTEIKPVPNVRNPAMLEEAEDFAKTMYAFRQAVVKYAVRLDRFFGVYPATLQHNLPRVWEAVEGHPGHCEPIRNAISVQHPSRIGGDFDQEMLQDSQRILMRRLEGVVKPVDCWLNSLQVAKDRMVKLKNLKLIVDARRRRISHKYEGILQRMRAREEVQPGGEVEAYEVGQVPVRAHEHVVQDEARQMAASFKQRKLEAARLTYDEQERLIFEQLSGLVCDTAYFKSYVAAALLIIKESLQASLCGLGPCKLPLPGYSLERSGVKVNGDMGTLDHLIAGMPESLKDATGHLAPFTEAAERVTVLEQSVHASPITMHPLQIAASRTTTPRYEGVSTTTAKEGISRGTTEELEVTEPPAGVLAGGVEHPAIPSPTKVAVTVTKLESGRMQVA